MSVVDVVASTVRENCVHHVSFDLRGHRLRIRHPACIRTRRLEFEIPTDPRCAVDRSTRPGEITEIGINQNGRCSDRIRILDPAKNDSVLGLDSTDLSDRHE
ncbi:unannotated protein [freshwater metagenome]|uniref:Unannotated protein n=1 Tax=freshwater metagenome TaxID=449393 RepID=A0A6J6DE18_9ZZZZ